MSTANGNGKVVRRCRAKGCQRRPNGGELGLCREHAAAHAADPDATVWKSTPRRTPRGEHGLWVTKLEEKVIDGTGAEVTVTELVCRALRAGSPMSFAAAYAGIAESTFHAWLKSGRSEGTFLERTFAHEVDKAIAEAVVGGVARISGSDDWRAHAWMLERRFPAEFGQVTRTELANADGQPFRTEGQVTQRLDISGWTPEQKRALLGALDGIDSGEIIDGEVIELDEHRALGT